MIRIKILLDYLQLVNIFKSKGPKVWYIILLYILRGESFGLKMNVHINTIKVKLLAVINGQINRVDPDKQLSSSKLLFLWAFSKYFIPKAGCILPPINISNINMTLEEINTIVKWFFSTNINHTSYFGYWKRGKLTNINLLNLANTILIVNLVLSGWVLEDYILYIILINEESRLDTNYRNRMWLEGCSIVTLRAILIQLASLPSSNRDIKLLYNNKKVSTDNTYKFLQLLSKSSIKK